MLNRETRQLYADMPHAERQAQRRMRLEEISHEIWRIDSKIGALLSEKRVLEEEKRYHTQALVE